MMPKMLLTQMKKNSDTRKASHLSPRLAELRAQDLIADEQDPHLADVLDAARHQLRRWNANQKNTTTMMVLSTTSRPGLPNPTLPTLNSGVK